MQDRGITRDLNWGIPVKKGKADWPGMDGKVFYVWFDAPIEYIACAEEWVDAGKGKDWHRWWKTSKGADDVIYTQFMGKDNVPFHTLSFPATILGSGEPWKLVDYIKSFNYLNYDGGQFSTSRNRGIFMDQALEILPPDYWRWWLLSHAPESSDSEFTWENFQQTVNKDLADVLGNFVSRVTKFCRSKFGEVIPTGGVWSKSEINLVNEIEKRVTDYEGYMESKEIRKSANELRAIWACGTADLVWIETPANPLIDVTDLPTVCSAPRRDGTILAVDSTFATPMCQLPLNLGADIVMHSATKFLGGHSDLLAGALIVRDDNLRDELDRKSVV